MEGSCSSGQSPQWAVVPVEEEEVNLSAVLRQGEFNTFSFASLLFTGRVASQK
jgi:hypothetical protein